MSFAPVSRVHVAPDPAVSGLSLQVDEDEGARYPAAPFEALVWPTQTRPVLGVNACQIQVTSVDGDTLTFTREDLNIPITIGLQVGVLHAQPVYEIGVAVAVNEDLGVEDGPYTYAVQSPSGQLGGFGTQDGVVNDGAGASHFAFTPDRAGQWRWRVLGQTKIGVEHALFVRFSDTIS